MCFLVLLNSLFENLIPIFESNLCNDISHQCYSVKNNMKYPRFFS
jgi:hypothetical protein